MHEVAFGRRLFRGLAVGAIAALSCGCSPSNAASETPEVETNASPSDAADQPTETAPTTEPDQAGADPSSDAVRLDPNAASSRAPGTIYRAELLRGTHNGAPPYLLQQLQPEPYRPNGRFLGWKVTTVWPGDPELCAPGCDLRAGDVIVTVNGKPIERPEQLSDLMAKVSTLDHLDVQMLREGKLRTGHYEIVD